MNKTKLGQSVQGRHIEVYHFGKGSYSLHIYGGIHGDEPESVNVVWRLMELLEKEQNEYKNKSLTIIPNLNPDGAALKTRVNANKVDLNRNFPSRQWSAHHELAKNYPGPHASSEPEVKALVKLIEEHPPKAILSVHSWIPQINFDGPAEKICQKMAEKNKYKITPHIGYSTNGSLGQWMGEDHHVPTITLEAPEKTDFEQVWKENKEALLAFIQYA